MQKYRVIQLLVIIGLMVFAIRAGAQEGEPKVEPGRGEQAVGRIPYNTTGGPDLYGYQFFTEDSGECPFQWITLSTTTAFANPDDGAVDVNLTHNFPFYGQNYTSVTFAANGFLSLPSGDTGSDLTEDCPLPVRPSSGIPGHARIYQWHEDLDHGSGDAWSFGQTDCSRNGNLGPSNEPCTVFGWFTEYFPDDGVGRWYMETILYQSGEIVMQYWPGTPIEDDDTRRPTIGIQNADYTSGLAASCGYNPLPNIGPGSAICFRRTNAVSRNPTGLQTLPVANITWTHLAGEEWYHVVISNQSGFSYDKWFKAADICGGTCSIPAPNFVNGQYDWKLEYYKDGGAGIRSDGTTTFMMAVPYPPSINRIEPFDGSVHTLPVDQIRFAPQATATWYHVVMSGPDGFSLNKWYKGTDVCTGGVSTCTVNIQVPPSSGQVTWKMEAWGPGGMGPENTTTYTQNLTAPGVFVGRTSPTNGQVGVPPGTVTLQWPNNENMVWYQVVLTGPGGFNHNQWYFGEDVCGVSTCSTQVTGLNTSGIYTWTMKSWNPVGLGPTDVTTFTVGP